MYESPPETELLPVLELVDAVKSRWIAFRLPNLERLLRRRWTLLAFFFLSLSLTRDECVFNSVFTSPMYGVGSFHCNRTFSFVYKEVKHQPTSRLTTRDFEVSMPQTRAMLADRPDTSIAKCTVTTPSATCDYKQTM